MVGRMRSSVLLVLWAWVGLVAAGVGFRKMSQYSDCALRPRGAGGRTRRGVLRHRRRGRRCRADSGARGRCAPRPGRTWGGVRRGTQRCAAAPVRTTAVSGRLRRVPTAVDEGGMSRAGERGGPQPSGRDAVRFDSEDVHARSRRERGLGLCCRRAFRGGRTPLRVRPLPAGARRPGDGSRFGCQRRFGCSRCGPRPRVVRRRRQYPRHARVGELAGGPRGHGLLRVRGRSRGGPRFTGKQASDRRGRFRIFRGLRRRGGGRRSP